MKNKIENFQSEITLDSNNEIDLSLIFSFLFRNKFLISAISFLFFLGFSLFALNKKKVWEGNFEIVLDNNAASTNSLTNLFPSALSSKFGVSSGSGLQTEVGILESPSVLMPTFNYLNNLKKKIDPNTQLFFTSWKNGNLKIELKDNTSILNISYRDTDKDLVIPVLNKISKTYQKYSGKNKRRSQELAKKFFNEQISIFKNKSANSLKAAQEFAIEQDLVFYDLGEGTQINREDYNTSEFSNTSLSAPKLLLPNIGIENSRVQAANRIRTINLQLKKIQELNNSEELQYIGSTIPALVDEGLPRALSDIEAKLLESKTNYTDKDEVIIDLVKKRKLAIDLLKNRTIKYLEVQKLNAEATMKAAMRPKGVLLKYKELIRKSARDEETLIKLEDRFNKFKLDIATQEDPWQLITSPTLKRAPVGPKKKSFAFMGIVTGFFVGLAASFYREKRSDYIFEKKFLIESLNVNMIDIFHTDDSRFENFSIDIFFNEFINIRSKGDLRFICTENISSEMLLIFRKVLEEYEEQNIDLFKSRKFIFDDRLDLVNDNDKVILLTSLNKLTYKEIKNLKTRVQNVNRNLYAFMLFEK